METFKSTAYDRFLTEHRLLSENNRAVSIAIMSTVPGFDTSAYRAFFAFSIGTVEGFFVKQIQAKLYHEVSIFGPERGRSLIAQFHSELSKRGLIKGKFSYTEPEINSQIHNLSSIISLTSSSKIEKFFSAMDVVFLPGKDFTICHSEIWHESISENADYKYCCGSWNLAIDRRNLIMHGGDLDSKGLPRAISAEQVETALSLAKIVATAFHKSLARI